MSGGCKLTFFYQPINNNQMSSVRRTKKAMKKSNGFFTIVADKGMHFCMSEWCTLKYHKKGISVDNAEYLPYSIMRKIISESI